MRWANDRGIEWNRDWRVNQKSMYRTLRCMDWLTGSFKSMVNVPFFHQSILPADLAEEVNAPLLCAFKDGSYQIIPVDIVGKNIPVYLGAKYNQLVSWGILPIHSSILHPGTDWNDKNILVDGRYIHQAVERITEDDKYFNYHLVCHLGQERLENFVSNLAFLWKKGYDTITSLVTGLLKFVESSDMNTQKLNNQNFHTLMSKYSLTPNEKSSIEP